MGDLGGGRMITFLHPFAELLRQVKATRQKNKGEKQRPRYVVRANEAKRG